MHGDRGELSKLLKMWVKVFFEHSLIIIKCNWGEFFPKLGKWISRIINYRKVAYYDTSLELWTEKKFTIKLIPVKSFMEGLVFLVAEIQIYYQSFPKSWRYNAEQE